jgi:hypothetical protein
MATLKNTTINDTGYLKYPSGTTAERPASPAYGMIRYNTTIDVLEQYTTIGWVGIEPSPVVTSVSGYINATTDTTLTINGSGFKSGSVVYIEGPAVSGSRSLTTTFVSGNQLTADTNAATTNFNGGESWDLKVQNPSGLSGKLEAVGTVDRSPVFNTASGSLATIYDQSRANFSTTISVTEPDGESLSLAVVSGSLPGGLSLNSSTGVISGTATQVAGDTTYSFTVRATGGNNITVDRNFSITVKKPVVVKFTSTGSSSWTAPSGVSKAELLVVGGGGGGGAIAGGGGGGGVLFIDTLSVSPGTTYPLFVGSGGSGGGGYPSPVGSNGDHSWFRMGPSSPVYHYGIGGGHGGSWDYSGGGDGGSGGGGPGTPSTGNNGGSALQPTYSSNSGPYGATAGGGYPGSRGGNNPSGNSTTGSGTYTGGGGGGAGQAGGHPSLTGPGNTSTTSAGRKGGDGLSYSTASVPGASSYYGGGGGGGQHQAGYTPPVNTSQGGAGGGGRGASYDYTYAPNGTGEPGTANTGGGGGGGKYTGTGTAAHGAGGSGIVVIKY